ncbi:M56 family metallopeptidase [Paenibacillus hexagrammi]|uniref:M56 family metallopeptidase n=1 Tax=Paenibacillus hexagrammi TaxID=2908839 RepID=A0ABY3SI10_9BACL|nr:M56 family metallopeptidase [Paenibacillus sp. YPD9-1]UJF33542.1 M56 family metallopeptidase [Paenibacillus sp. YPD9-1]
MIGLRPRFMLLATLLTSGFLWCQLISYEIGHLLRLKPLFNLFDMCFFLFRTLHIPALVAGNLVHGLVMYTFGAAAWVAIRHARSFARSSRELELRTENAVTEKLRTQYGLADEELLVIRHQAPIALTMGLWKPRIILSTALLDMLTEGELRAVVEHEKYHLQQKDPLTIFALMICSVSLGYIPIFRWIADKYKIMMELSADKHAISVMEHTAELGSALLKLWKRGQSPHVSLSHASFAETSMNLRIQHILNPQLPISFKLPLVRTVISAVAMIIVVGLI